MSQTLRGPARTSAAPSPRRVPGFWLALLGAPAAFGTTTPALILGDIGNGLGVSIGTSSWIVTTYACGAAVGTPLMAGLVRRRGVRTALLTSALIALIGSVLVALSPWFGLIVLGRAGQAVGAAGLITTAMNLAGTTRRMGLITAGIAMCGALGTLAGELVTGWSSWHLALILPAVSLLAVPAVLGNTDRGRAPAADGRFDGAGAVVLTALVVALVFIPHYPLPAVLGALVFGVLLALRVRARPEGFVPATVLGSRAFVLFSLLAFALAGSYFALLYAVPRLLTQAGWGSGQIGTGQLVAMLIGSAASLVMTATAARLSRSAVLAILVVLGLLAPLTAAVTPWAPLLLAVIAVALFSAAAGQGVLTVFATAAVPAAQRPTAIGLFNLCYQLGGAFGPALVVLLAIG